MTEFVLVADGWRRVTKWTDSYPKEALDWTDYVKGDVVNLDPENDTDKLDIIRLADVTFRPALVEKAKFDAVNQANQRAALAVAAARAATLSGPHTPLLGSVETEEGEGQYPAGDRVDAAGSSVGAGGTDPEPGGLVGEAGGSSYDDTAEWSYADLQAAARARGLSASGSRSDLVGRLREFDESNTDELARRAASGTLDDDDKDTALRN
jgi:hypothetical protein